jgi:hypothetical protein
MVASDHPDLAMVRRGSASLRASRGGGARRGDDYVAYNDAAIDGKYQL